MTDLKKINITRIDRDTDCVMEDKISVTHPEVSVPLNLFDLVVQSKNGKDMFLNYDQAWGHTFMVPTCPCTGQYRYYRGPITVKSWAKWKELRETLLHAGWMEQAVCWSNVKTTAPLPNSSPLPREETFGLAQLFKETNLLSQAPESIAVPFSQHVASTALQMGISSLIKSTIKGEAEYPRLEEFSSATAEIGSFILSQKGEDRSDCEEVWDVDRCEGYILPDGSDENL